MALGITGWGKWGSDVISALDNSPPASSATRKSITEKDLGYPHSPDPVVSDLILTKLPAGKLGNIGDSSLDFNLHIIHAADNFASGAIAGLMRRRAELGSQLHLGLVLLPPAGSNSATVGRLLTNIAGLKRFFDVCILLDSSAQTFSSWDSSHFITFAANLAALFCCLESSACMIPLLKQMDARFLSFSSAPLSRILADCSLELFWQRTTMPFSAKLPAHLQPAKMLVFSVSPDYNNALYKLFRRNLAPDNFLYVPFLRLYGWRSAHDPFAGTHTSELRGGAFKLPFFSNGFSSGSEYGGNPEYFAGLFCSDMPTTTMLNFIRKYTEKYWPDTQGHAKYESIEAEVKDWLVRSHLPTTLTLQHRYLVRSALDFFKQSRKRQRNLA